MMRSLYSGVSGLRTHQTKMDVIGNNIANVNTTAYKTMQINFSDLMYQTTQAATGPNATTGTAGTNPRQIGLGVQTAAISTKITEQGATQSTGNPFDLKITGDEFFVVSDGSNTYFTRDGSFYVDAAGNLAMSSTGYNVMGWQVDEETGNIKKDTVSKLVVLGEDTATYPAEYTSAAIASGVVDWNDDDQTELAGKTLNLQIYDNLGYSYTVKMSIHNAKEGKLETGKDYQFYTVVDSIVDSTGKEIWNKNDANAKPISFGQETVDVELDEGVEKLGLNVNPKKITLYATDGTTTTMVYAATTVGGTTTSYLVFPADGVPTGTWYTDSDCTSAFTAPTATQVVNNDTLAITDEAQFKALFGDKISKDDLKNVTTDKEGRLVITKKTVKNCFQINYDGETGKVSSGGTTTLDLTKLGDAFTTINVDFTKTVVADNKGTSTIKVEKGDKDSKDTGRALGTLSGVSIQTNGMIYASYTNGQQRLLGQIAVAEFANASGLQKEGDNLYSATQNSGDFDGIGVDISANGDRMNTGQLEMSNVDLSSEFTDMITTQRGFQANSRIITVSDTLLEELVNLKR